MDALKIEKNLFFVDKGNNMDKISGLMMVFYMGGLGSSAALKQFGKKIEIDHK